jgi:two-component sensor histidine kinase
MVLHELATNAVKHGALSKQAGRVAISWGVNRQVGSIVLIWRERGGPHIAATPTRRGFGSRVIEATVENQLGGAVEWSWEKEGLVCTIAVPIARVLAGHGASAGAPPAL